MPTGPAIPLAITVTVLAEYIYPVAAGHVEASGRSAASIDDEKPILSVECEA